MSGDWGDELKKRVHDHFEDQGMTLSDEQEQQLDDVAYQLDEWWEDRPRIGAIDYSREITVK